MSPEAELAELTSAMLATADRVIAVVRELGGGEGGGGEGEEGERGGNGELWEVNSTDEYMQTMSPLQFGTSIFFSSNIMIKILKQIPMSLWRKMRVGNSVSWFHSTTRIVSSLVTPHRTARGEPGDWPRRCRLWPPPSLSPPPPLSLSGVTRTDLTS